MISPQEEELLWVFDFVTHQQTDSLNTLFRSIHVITHEQVVPRRGESTGFEKTQKVEELTVGVSADVDWGAHL